MFKKIFSVDNSNYVGLVILATTGLNSVLGFVFWFLAAKKISETEIGYAGGIIPALATAALIGSGGVGPVILVLKNKLFYKTFRKIILVSMPSTGVAGAVLAFFLYKNIDDSYLNTLLIVVFGGVITSLSIIVDAVLIGRGKIYNFFLKNILVSATKIILVVTIPFDSATTLVLLWLTPLVIITMLYTIYSLIIVKNNTEYLYKNKKYWLSSHLAVIFSQVTFLLLPIIVLSRLGPVANSTFYISLLLAGAVLMIPPAFANSFMAKEFDNNISLFNFLKKQYYVVVVLQILVGFTIYLLGDYLLNILGQTYSSNKIVFAILLLSGIPSSFLTLNNGFLRKKHHLSGVALVSFIVTTVSLTLAIFLSTLGLAFVALSLLTGQLVGAGLSYVLVRKIDANSS